MRDDQLADFIADAFEHPDWASILDPPPKYYHSAQRIAEILRRLPYTDDTGKVLIPGDNVHFVDEGPDNHGVRSGPLEWDEDDGWLVHVRVDAEHPTSASSTGPFYEHEQSAREKAR